MKQFKNTCKFGLFVKDLDRIVESQESFFVNKSGNILTLLKEHKIVEIQETITTVIEKNPEPKEDIGINFGRKPKKHKSKDKNIIQEDNEDELKDLSLEIDDKMEE